MLRNVVKRLSCFLSIWYSIANQDFSILDLFQQRVVISKIKIIKLKKQKYWHLFVFAFNFKAKLKRKRPKMSARKILDEKFDWPTETKRNPRMVRIYVLYKTNESLQLRIVNAYFNKLSLKPLVCSNARAFLFISPLILTWKPSIRLQFNQARN